VLGIIGLMKTAKPVPVSFQSEGAHLVLLGGFGQTDLVQFGSSQYAKVIIKNLWGQPPKLDMAYEKRVHEAMREIVAQGLAESAHDLSEGGLAVALAESSTLALGAKSICGVGVNACALFHLFNESPSRILISTHDPKQIQSIALQFGVQSPIIGVTMKGRLQIGNEDHMLIDVATADLKHSFEDALPRLLKTQNAA
jgi:phosphoribosylformylglycinamidine synthase